MSDDVLTLFRSVFICRSFDFDPTQRLTFWSTVIGGTFSTLGIFGVGQANVQRYCSLPTLAQAKRLVISCSYLYAANCMTAMF